MPSESKATERCCPEKIVTSAVPSTASATRMKMASTAPKPRRARLRLRQVADVDFLVEPDFFVGARELEGHRHPAQGLGTHPETRRAVARAGSCSPRLASTFPCHCRSRRAPRHLCCTRT